MRGTESFVPSALLGTSQISSPEAMVSTVAGVQSQFSQEEDKLLAGIAGSVLVYKAGFFPLRHQGAKIPPFQGMRTQAAPNDLTGPVELLLSGGPKKSTTIKIMLDWLIQQNLHPPAKLYPNLMNWGGGSRGEYRDTLRSALGAKGKWLAQCSQTKYPWLEEDLSLKAFETADKKLRCAILENVWVQDETKARDLFFGAFPQEKADGKAAFLEVLEPHLSAQDTEFILGLLNDPSTTVKATARRLAYKLPDSLLAQRMFERATQFIRGGGMFSFKLSIDLPKICPEDWVADGIESLVPKHQKLKPQEWWLHQLVAHTRPSAWLKHFKIKLPVFLAAIEKNGGSFGFQNALNKAAGITADHEFAIESFALAPRTDLFRVLTQEEKNRVLALEFQKPWHWEILYELLADLLEEIPGVLDESLSKALLGRLPELHQRLTGNQKDIFKKLLETAAWRFHPGATQEAGKMYQGLNEEQKANFFLLYESLAHRQTIHSIIFKEIPHE